jgi:hypothetical protein
MNFLKQYSLFIAIVVAFFVIRRGGCWNADGFNVFSKSVSGSGAVLHDARALTGFERVSHNVPCEVEVTQDSTFSVQIDAQKEVMEILETTVEDNTLKIRIKKGYSLGRNEGTKIFVRAPRFVKFSVAGSGDIIAKNNLISPALEASVAGSGKILLQNVQSDAFSASVAGSGDIICSGGSAAKGDLSIAGSGNIKTENLVTQDLGISISGSGDIWCNAEKTLAVSISGSGDVRYKGNGVPSTSVSGSGSVSRF